jgi:hypothetical protein
MRRITVTAAALALGLTVSLVVVTEAYTTHGKWSSSPVGYYINPANLDVSAAAAGAAVQAGANAWSEQSSANFRFVSDGQVSDTTTGYDRRNVVLFRNSSSGSAIATTYYWMSGGEVVDADIIFWDGARTFFTGSSGCSSGAYIEDVATHEFGHVLGLSHSSVSGATMYPSYSGCSVQLRSLAADDIAGVEALYPPASANTAPTVSISTPSSGASFTENSTISFTGSANDNEDGSLGSGLVWLSSRDGQIGTGSSFSRVLSVGSHTVTARVTDSNGAVAQATRSLTVQAPVAPTDGDPDGFSLTGRGYKVKGAQKVDLTWSGSTAGSIDVYRNGTRVAITPNDGVQTDPINQKGGATYIYKVCAATTSTCSNPITIVF